MAMTGTMAKMMMVSGTLTVHRMTNDTTIFSPAMKNSPTVMRELSHVEQVARDARHQLTDLGVCKNSRTTVFCRWLNRAERMSVSMRAPMTCPMFAIK